LTKIETVEPTPEVAAQIAADTDMVPIGIPQNRHYRRLTASRAVRVERGRIMDRPAPINELLDESNPEKGYRVLHATKGWRTYTKRRLNVISGVDQMREGWASIARAIARTFDPARLSNEKPTVVATEPKTARQLPREIVPAEPPLAQGGYESRQVRRAAERAKSKELTHG
jgi:hypothetical protein